MFRNLQTCSLLEWGFLARPSSRVQSMPSLHPCFRGRHLQVQTDAVAVAEGDVAEAAVEDAAVVVGAEDVVASRFFEEQLR